jgi:hypothetical protein
MQERRRATANLLNERIAVLSADSARTASAFCGRG